MKKPEWEKVDLDQKGFLLKEIEIIQKQITKCDESSLIVKGWAITLWSALILFAISQILDEIKISTLWISIISLFAFWIVDAYFKYFQRMSIARSNLISDYLNKNCPKNGQDYMFRIYDPVGRLSKERKEIKKVRLFCFSFSKKEKRKNNYYWKNYVKSFSFFRSMIVRVVSTFYCILFVISFIFMNTISQDLLYAILTGIFLILGIIFFILSHMERI